MRGNYMPLPSYFSHRDDPVNSLPGGDELAAQLAEAIGDRFSLLGERHVHPKRGGCESCATAAADTVVRYLEANTRVVHSEALGREEHERARRALKSIGYLGSGYHLRLIGDLAADPGCPTVDDLLADIETIRAAVVALREHDSNRERELRLYRSWREAVAGLAHDIVEQFDQLAAEDR